mgnify:CR=1 FL=1
MSKHPLVISAVAHHAAVLRWAGLPVHELPTLAHAYADGVASTDPEHPLNSALIAACSGERVLVSSAPSAAAQAQALASAILVQTRAQQCACIEVPVGAHQA